METKRLCIYTKDVMLITGKSAGYARKMLTEIKKHYSKKPNQLVTVREFCNYFGFTTEEIEKYLSS